MMAYIEHEGEDGSGDPDGWDVDHDNHVVLAAGQTVDFRVNVTAPQDAPGGLQYPLEVSAEDTEDPTMLRKVGILAEVNYLYGLNASMEPGVMTAFPGEWVDYTVQVGCVGNTDETVTASLRTLPHGWTGALTLPDDDTGTTEKEFIVARGGWCNATLSLLVPEGTRDGSYHSTINVTSRATGQWALLQATILVGRVYDIGVIPWGDGIGDPESRQVTHTVAPGTSTIQQVQVTNRGNTDDTIELEASCAMEDRADGWDCSIVSISNFGGISSSEEFVDFTIPLAISNSGGSVVYRPDNASAGENSVLFTLGPGESAYAGVEILTPVTANDRDEVSVTISGESVSLSEDTSDNSVEVLIDIDLSDLTFGGAMQYPSDMREGEAYTFMANVKNVGDIAAEHFWVALYVDDDEVDRVRVQILMPNKTWVVGLNWIAKSGDHRYMMMVDSEEEVIESDEQNNILFSGKGYSPDPEEKSGSTTRDLTYVWTAMALVTVVVLMVVAYKVRKRRKREEEGGGGGD
jgi:uncharacterized membrane protein